MKLLQAWPGRNGEKVFSKTDGNFYYQARWRLFADGGITVIERAPLVVADGDGTRNGLRSPSPVIPSTPQTRHPKSRALAPASELSVMGKKKAQLPSGVRRRPVKESCMRMTA